MNNFTSALNKVYNAATPNDKPTLKNYMEQVVKEADKITATETQAAATSIDQAKNTVQGLIAAREELICEFCKGWGHRAKFCATLKGLNRQTAGVPALKAAWGSMKAKYLGTAAKTLVLKGTVGRKKRVIKMKDKEAKFSAEFSD